MQAQRLIVVSALEPSSMPTSSFVPSDRTPSIAQVRHDGLSGAARVLGKQIVLLMHSRSFGPVLPAVLPADSGSGWSFLRGSARLGASDRAINADFLSIRGKVEKPCRLLLRALPHAENEMDRCFIELDLANAYRRRGEDARALELANGIVECTRERSDLTMVRATAFELRWRLTGDASDFRTAKRNLEGIEDSRARFRLLMMLIDHGDLDDADGLLEKEQAAGDIGTVLLAIDIRLRTNRIQEAEELLRGIPADHIAPQLRLPYAHTAGLVALHSKKAEVAETASAMLRCIEAEEGGLPVDCEAVLEGLDALRG